MSKLVYNTTKEYPKMFVKIFVYNTPFEISETTKQRKQKHKKHIADDPLNRDASLHSSLSRSRTTISDVIICNRFDWFATFTFDPKKLNRYDFNVCVRYMSTWLFNQRKHSPDFRYLIVPEKHKDGAFHFHAVFSNFHGSMRKTKIRQKGRPIYNLTGFRGGFTTAVKIDSDEDSKHAVACYIKKYITKDMPVMYGRKRFWTSRNLTRPIKTTNGVFIKRMTRFLQEKYKTYSDDYLTCYQVSSDEL